MSFTEDIETPPLDPAGFSLLWRRLGAPRRFAVALSGGGDSVALLRLSAPLQASGEAEIIALTVDHGLRPQSGAEAKIAGEWSRAVGVEHATLFWAGEKPKTGVQAAARSARYKLLAAAAQAAGADALFTAHNADDQAETVFMRMKRRSGVRGMAAMPAVSQIAAGAGPPIALMRPLLAYRRNALRNFLVELGQPFIDDPSNDDVNFERVRVRQSLAAAEAAGGADISALLAQARKARTERNRLDDAERTAFAAVDGRFHEWGGASLEARAADVRYAALAARLVHAVSGAAHRPDHIRVGEALALVRDGRKATIGGALLALWRGRVFFMREPAAVCGRAGVRPLEVQDLGPGERICWDNRFIVANPTEECAALGAGEWRKFGSGGDVADAIPADAIPPDTIPAGSFAPAAALAAAPILRFQSGLVVQAGAGVLADTCFQPLAGERFYRQVLRFH